MASSYRFCRNNLKNILVGKHNDWNSENKYIELLCDIEELYGLSDRESIRKVLSVCSIYALVTHHRHQLSIREIMQYNNMIKRYEKEVR